MFEKIRFCLFGYCQVQIKRCIQSSFDDEVQHLSGSDSYRCETCSTRQSATKTMVYFRLILQFSRFYVRVLLLYFRCLFESRLLRVYLNS